MRRFFSQDIAALKKLELNTIYLLVSNPNTLHYTNKNERGRKAISDFIEALKVYKKYAA